MQLRNVQPLTVTSHGTSANPGPPIYMAFDSFPPPMKVVPSTRTLALGAVAVL